MCVACDSHLTWNNFPVCQRCARAIHDAYRDSKATVDGFDAFWALYPRKVAKKPAQLAWGRLTKRDQEAAMLVLPEHIKHPSWQKENGLYVPHAATWLHQRRWEDEIQQTETKWWKAAK